MRLVYAAMVYMHIHCLRSHIFTVLSSPPVATWRLGRGGRSEGGGGRSGFDREGERED